MKRKTYKLLLVIIALLTIAGTIRAQKKQNSEPVCKLGLQYQRSHVASWGKGYPVVISIIPNSSAEKAGVKEQDIIMEVDGENTVKLSDELLNNMLSDTGKSHQLKIKNKRHDAFETIVTHDCKPADALTERQMAEAFAFYSLEDMNERRLTYPFVYQIDQSFDLLNVSTFAFAQSASENKVRDEKINKHIANRLIALGMRENPSNPDIIIDNYYTMKPNTDILPVPDMPSNSWRYNFNTAQMDDLPLLPLGIPASAAPYEMKLGIRFANAKNKSQIVWKCEARELLSQSLSVETYAEYTVPVMMLEYPFVRTAKFPTYRFGIHQYNYTGILYDKNDLSLIADVESDSPAFKSGLRKGDRILKINGIPMKKTNARGLSEDYIKFIDDTNQYRDLRREFTNSDRLAHCRYWNPNYYKNVAKEFNRKKYNTVFAYLFFFRPYINKTEKNELVFEVMREGNEIPVIVKPVKMEESVIIPD